MQDPNNLELQRQAEEERLTNPFLVKQAAAQKRRRFVPRGFITLAIGVVLLVIGLLLHTGVRSFEGVLVGVGVIVIIIGIIMVLIGVINPVVPEQVNPPPPTVPLVDQDEL
ncbi:MAG TPA: hypothetical protein VKV40_22085 [Ktedonobacteraceae bacterium]|nr:hypothetical protein [Ktedonobacteraceae bacterium]